MAEKIGELRGIPFVEVTRVTDRGSSEIDDCPFCGADHSHGFIEDGIGKMMSDVSRPSHRGAHCTSPRDGAVDSGYYLVYTKNTDGVVFEDDGVHKEVTHG